LSTIHSEVFLIATYKEFIGNSNAITDGNKVNEAADKFRSEYMVLRSPVSCFDTLLQALG